VQRIQIVRQVEAWDGSRQEETQHRDINFDTITADEARGYLTDVGRGKARFSNEEEPQQLRDVINRGRHIPLLEEHQMIEAAAQGIIVRFAQSGATLQQEVDLHRLSGHKLAVYDITGLIKGIEAESRIAADRPNAAVLNFQEGLRAAVETAVSMLNRSAVIATSSRLDDDDWNKLLTWANKATYISDVHATVPLNPLIVTTHLPIDTGAQLQAAVTDVTKQLIDYIKALVPVVAAQDAVQGDDEGKAGDAPAEDEDLDPRLHQQFPDLYHPNGRARMVDGIPQNEDGTDDLT
jgi:hypothetical protein